MTNRPPLTESFSVIPLREGTALIRDAVPRTTGNPYRHSCPLAAFETVAHAIGEAGDEGFTLTSLQAETGLPFTQVATAMAFLRERGIIEVRFGRRNFPATDAVHIDAMTEYHALREGDRDD